MRSVQCWEEADDHTKRTPVMLRWRYLITETLVTVMNIVLEVG